MRRLASLLCLLLAPLPALAEIVWKSGFETGDRREWSSAQVVSGEPERLKVVGDVKREGKHAMKATVVYGDKPIIASGNRNELIKMTLEPTGSEYWYRWSVRFGSTFPSEKTWQLFTQWHHQGNNGSPPVEFYVYGEEIRLNIGGNPGKIVWRTAMQRGVWFDFAFRVRWSPDPKLGLVELYLNGKQVLPPLSIATQFRDEKGQPVLNYLKAGLYRDDKIKTTAHLYLDAFVIGTKQSDVMPLPTTSTPSDAGTAGPVDAGTAPRADAGVPGKVDAGTPGPSDAGVPRVDAGTPAKADAGTAPRADGGVDAGAPARDAGMDAGTKTQASGLDAGARPPDGGTTAPPPARDGGVAPAAGKDGGCSAGGGDLLIPGALLSLALVRVWRIPRA